MLSTFVTFTGNRRTPTVVTLKTNGGTLLFEKKVGTEWIASPAMTVNGSYSIDTGVGECRFTPTGGAVYEFTQ